MKLTSFLVLGMVIACGSPQSTDRTPAPLPGSKSNPKASQLPAIAPPMDVKRVAPDAGHTPSARSPILSAMAEENKRWMNVLRHRRNARAYYLAYQMFDQRSAHIRAEGGALIATTDDRERFLDVEVRVGTPQLDNRHPLTDERNAVLNQPLPRRGRAPFGTDRVALQNQLWLETDRRYREAAQQLTWVHSDKKVIARGDTPPDFVHEKAEVFVQPIATLRYDKDAWVRRLKRCSKRALRGKATRGACNVHFALHTVYFVNSEGSQLQLSWPSARLEVSVGVKTPDGQPLSRSADRFVRSPADLPSNDEIDELIREVTDSLSKLHDSPVVDPYVGPAILKGRAAGVFFHEVFGHRVEGHRQKGEISGQTFSSKVGEKIMPEWLSVYDDPTLRSMNGIALNGFYRFDDEGVRAQRAMLIDSGVMRGFVLGRNPIKGFGNSNGHGRKEPGYVSVSRQGNLVIEAKRTVPDDELEALLIAEVKRQNKPFGMIFTDISGGFTNTTKFAPQAFKVNPVLAYRLYPNGKKELVRGVDIVGTPLTALGSVIAAGRKMETFNGMCGAESGWVPVSASAPSLLLKQLEIERGFKAVDRPPVLPPPSVRKHSPPRNVQP